MAASKGGHDDGIGGNIRVIKSGMTAVAIRWHVPQILLSLQRLQREHDVLAFFHGRKLERSFCGYAGGIVGNH